MPRYAPVGHTVGNWRELHPRMMDGYVAVHVLGYTYRSRFKNDSQGYFERAGEDSVIFEELPAYCADLGASGEILRWMTAHGSGVSLSWDEESNDWECSWITGGVRYTGRTDQAAMAICTAALRAVGKDC